MRRTWAALPALAAVLVGATPASAATHPSSSSSSGSGWEPAPQAPFDTAAGARCDFPVHGEPIVDEVVQRVLDTYPDGAPKRVEYKGDLIVRVINTDTGAFWDADAGGRAVVDHRADGSELWSVVGPVLFGFAENGGTLARGLYIVDGVYTMDISPTRYKTLTMLHGTTDPLCARID
ncbi:hypothetical protein B7755_003865 [Streptomyces sp. NBS 14/10]|uniref:hypothetical protein n=1 Tax=Streptomyces sp. NBS 14/10 TaxID=1945643 RepID=UPI000B7FD647|nr:hypothetical protein [Streptomyces sp. NBS 14/10]KAK1177369.1 hypothetical protein B7755_003865 [Streptomyces sp. NBS 14/10]